MVKPICSEPFQRRLQRRVAVFDVPADVLNHHDGVVDHEARRNRQRHQRKIVQRIAQQVHHAKRANDGKRNRDAGNHRCPGAAQKQKYHHYDQRNRQQQCELHIGHRRANRCGTIRQRRHLNRRRQRRLQLRQNVLHAVNHRNNIRAGLPLNIQNHGGLLVGPCRLPNIFGSVDGGCHVAEPHGRSIAERDHDVAIALARKQLVVRANRIRLLLPVERPLGLVDVRVPQRRPQILQA